MLALDYSFSISTLSPGIPFTFTLSVSRTLTHFVRRGSTLSSRPSQAGDILVFRPYGFQFQYFEIYCTMKI